MRKALWCDWALCVNISLILRRLMYKNHEGEIARFCLPIYDFVQKKDSKNRYRIPWSYSVVPPVRNNIGKICTWMKQKVIPPFFKGNVQAMIINIDPEIRRIIGHLNRPIECVRECMCLQGFANKNVYISSHNLWRTAVCRIIKGLAFYSSKRPILRVIGGEKGVVPHTHKGDFK